MNIHKFIPFLLTSVLFGLLQLATVNSGAKGEDPVEKMFSELPGKIEIKLVGHVNSEDYIAVQDTLMAYFAEYAPKDEIGNYDWGMDLWSPENNPELQATTEDDNLKIWADLNFYERSRVFDWINDWKDSPLFDIQFGETESDIQSGTLSAWLPVPGKSGKSLEMKEFNFKLRII